MDEGTTRLKKYLKVGKGPQGWERTSGLGNDLKIGKGPQGWKKTSRPEQYLISRKAKDLVYRNEHKFWEKTIR